MEQRKEQLFYILFFVVITLLYTYVWIPDNPVSYFFTTQHLIVSASLILAVQLLYSFMQRKNRTQGPVKTKWNLLLSAYMIGLLIISTSIVLPLIWLTSVSVGVQLVIFLWKTISKKPATTYARYEGRSPSSIH
ncbi:hypothetical protein N781_15630 [Pontibacillus halophilus JSM 076056 = DSM 19796]|uniref:Uncharacterized protein n=1 Tax=Pontibacillus halophilus JSM 076056 = DSM 19796 TaxID=1385510 RepID=A0A0A5GNH3_9BACI|nr:hypothetical protein [Pontibacillus halophilus]KGX92803.1 hypothetical protein N781_15630 [Pontibacillus halophilus JSM 076056 = DSM 19796]